MLKSVKRVLQKLLDIYERRIISGTNLDKRPASVTFDKKIIPEYSDLSSVVFEDIDEFFKHLEEQGAIRIVWKDKLKKRQIQKIILKAENVNIIYSLLKRIPKAEKIKKVNNTISELKEKYPASEICQQFLTFLELSLSEGKEERSLLDIYDLQGLKTLAHAISSLEENKNENYIREFSVRHFGDTKVFEKIESKVCRIVKKFVPEYASLNDKEILEQFNLFSNPNYVYFKGNARIRFNKDSEMDLNEFNQGIAFSENDAGHILILNPENIKKVVTIENLTTFSHWQEPDSLIIYLGGFHNRSHRKLLENIVYQLPDAEYYHFGDIDVGGFLILFDLVRKTEIPFIPYMMDISILKRFRQFAKSLTKNDRIRLEHLIEEVQNLNEDHESKINKESIKQTLEYMLEKNIKLEQEVITANLFS